MSFDKRYVVLSKDDLSPYALQVIELIEGVLGDDIGHKKLIVGIQKANQGMVNKRAVEFYEALMSLGFLCKKG